MSEFQLLVNGRLTPGDLEMPVINPATEEVLATCPPRQNASWMKPLQRRKLLSRRGRRPPSRHAGPRS
jgi:hypothetical protein